MYRLFRAMLLAWAAGTGFIVGQWLVLLIGLWWPDINRTPSSQHLLAYGMAVLGAWLMGPQTPSLADLLVQAKVLDMPDSLDDYYLAVTVFALLAAPGVVGAALMVPAPGVRRFLVVGGVISLSIYSNAFITVLRYFWTRRH